jgi:hypothetical protein
MFKDGRRVSEPRALWLWRKRAARRKARQHYRKAYRAAYDNPYRKLGIPVEEEAILSG